MSDDAIPHTELGARSMELDRLLEASERHQTLFLNAPFPILVFNSKGILDCNPAAIKILGGKKKHDLLAHHPAVFSPELQPDGRKSSEKAIEMDRLARESGSHRFEWIHKKIDGTEFPVEVVLAPIVWDNADALLVLWIDLTEKKKQELQMISTSKLASLGIMSAGIAHEINNPLAIILGTLDLLPRFMTDPEKFATKIETLRKSCKRISKIVTALKKFSTTNEKSTKVDQSLNVIIQKAMNVTESKSIHESTPITCELKTEALVQCDEIEMEQVILNLINNAIDAVKNRTEKWVKLCLFEDKSSVVLQIIDSGSGIPENIRTKLFNPFFTTKEVGEGTGLGLSITKGILDDHQATIAVLPEMSNTCFEIRFPKVNHQKSAA